MEWYEIQSAYEVTRKIFAAEPPLKSPNKDYFLLETSDNISDFLCQILLKSKTKLDVTVSGSQKDLKEFNKINHANLNYEEFIEKFWLREILGDVYLPSVVLKYAEQEYKNKGNNIEPSLLYIKAFHEKYGYEDTREFVITKDDFDAIYNKFKNFNSSFPSKAKLLIKYNFKENQNNYYFKLWDLSRKISGNLPIKLLILLYKQKNNDEKVLLNWIKLVRFVSIKNILNELPEGCASLFLNTTALLLKSEKDLIFKDSKSEITKILLDSYSFFHEKLDIFNLDTSDFSIDFSNPLKFWFQMCYANKTSHMEIFATDIREIYVKFLVAIVNDNNPYRCKKTLQVLLSSNTPYIFLEIIFLLRNQAQEKMLLLIDSTPAGIVFLCEYLECCLSDTLRYNKFSSSINTQLKSVFQSFLNQFLKQSGSDAKLLAFILLYLLKLKDFYKRDSRKEIIETFISELRIQCRNYTQKGQNPKFVEGYTEYYGLFVRAHDNSFRTLPFEYYFTLMDFWKDDKAKTSTIASRLYGEYLSALSITSQISVMDAYQKIMEFEWVRLVGYLFETDKNKFDSFCCFAEQFFDYRKPKTSKDYDFNTNNAAKIRIHLIVLVNAFLSSRFVNKKLHNQLENVLYNILKKSFSNSSSVKNKKIFLFSSLYESRVAFNQEILPYISKAILILNSIHKEKLFQIILKEAPYSIWFEVYELLEETDRKFFEEEISKLDLTKIQDNSFTIPELYSNTVRVINSNLSNSLSHNLFNKLDAEVRKKAEKGIVADFTINCEALRLFFMYRDNKRKNLENYTFPYSYNNYEFKDAINDLDCQKRYYMSLFDMADNKITAAYNKLVGVVKEKPDNEEYKAMFLYVSCFEKIENKDSDFSDLLAQIEQMLENTDSSQYFYERLQYAKLVILDEIGATNKLEYFYSLPESLRTNVHYVERVINDQKEKDKDYNKKQENKDNRKKLQNKAFELFYNISEEWKESSSYKRLAKQFKLEEQDAANKHTYVSENIKTLQGTYEKIICLPDSERFKVLPENISVHHNDAGDFILYELYQTLQSILEKIVPLTNFQTKKEDVITDLVEILLKARLQKLKYDLAVQGRSGISESGDSCGEPDVRISFQTYKIVLEAIRFTKPSYNDLKKHILKIFKYDSSRQYLFDLIYFQESDDVFLKRWNSIKEKIFEIGYPVEYQISRNVDMVQDYQNAGIRVLKVFHENGLVFYHVMVNLCYTGQKINNV